MKFFDDLKKSIYDPEYYKGLVAKPFSYSVKYFFALIFCLTILNTIFLSSAAIPKITLGIDMIESGILQYYPDHLEVIIKNGKASSNVQEPYFIKYPTKSGVTSEMPQRENLLVIDTKDDFSLGQFKNFKTECILNRDSLSCFDKEGKVVSASDLPDYTINKSVISDFFTKIQPYVKFVYPLFIVIFFIGLFLAFLFHFVYLLVGALLIWLVARIQKFSIGYKKSYQLGLHLLTLPLIIGCIINCIALFAAQVHTFFLFPTAVLIIMAFLNLRSPSNLNK